MNKNFQSKLFHGLFFATIFSLALGQLGRFDTTWGGLYLHDGSIGLWLTVLVGQTVHSFISRSQKIPVATILKSWQSQLMLLGFFLWVFLGWAWFSVQHGQLPLRAIVYASKLVCYGAWGAYVVPHYISKQLIQHSLLLIQTVGVIFGLAFFLLMPDARFLAILGWDDHYFRFLGVHLDPNITGLHLVLFWTVLTTQLVTNTKTATHQTITIIVRVLLVLTSLAIILTFSRAAYLAWLAAAIGSIFLMIVSKPKMKWTSILVGTTLLLLCGLGILATVNTKLEGQNLFRTASIKARLASTHSYLAPLKGGEWLLGSGLFVPQPSQLHADNRAFLPDSWPITLLVGTGWIGLLFWLTLLGQYLRLPSLVLADRRLTQLLVLVALFHALSINSFFYGFTWILLSLWIGSTRRVNT